MSETLTNRGGVEGSSHWCLTYQGLQRQLSVLERTPELRTIPGMSEKYAPEAWENTSYYLGPYVPEIEDAKTALYLHRTSCGPCIAHFTPESGQ